MPVRRSPFRPILLALGLGLLAGCEQAGSAAGSVAGTAAAGAVAGSVGGPAGQAAGAAAGAGASIAVAQLTRMSTAAAQGAWDAVAQEPVAACTGAADKPCAEAQALRARACRRQAAAAARDAGCGTEGSLRSMRAAPWRT